MGTNPNCMGCLGNYYSCTDWSLMCPCTTCLVKVMCDEACESYITFEENCCRDNKDRMKDKRHIKESI